MALIWLDGFDSYGNGGAAPAPTNIMAKHYTMGGEAVIDMITAGRTGNAVSLGEGSTWFRKDGLGNIDTIIFGFAIKFQWTSKASIFGSNYFVGLKESTTVQSFRIWQSRGELGLYIAGATTSDVTTGLNLQPDTWYYIEAKVFSHASTGTVEVRLDGVTIFDLSGLDTKAGSGFFDQFFMVGVSVNAKTIDDLYICDDTGSVNNDFLGPTRIHTISPDGDDTTNATTATPSANHFENVDEAVIDYDTSYNDGTTGQRELYDYEAVAELSPIAAIQMHNVVKGAPGHFQHLIKSGTTENTSANVQASTGSYQYFFQIAEQDPDASAAWTVTTVSAAKFGLDIIL